MIVGIVILLAVGVVNLIGSVFFLCNQIKWYRKGKPVSATVTDSYVSCKSDSGNTYTIKVEYEIDGEKYESSFTNGSFKIRIGKKISVLYDPNNPKDIIYRRPIRAFASVLIPVGVGLGGIVGGLCLLNCLLS